VIYEIYELIYWVLFVCLDFYGTSTYNWPYRAERYNRLKCYLKLSDLKTLLRQGISQPGFYGDVIYKLRKILGHGNFSADFTKIIKRSIKRDYDPTILRHTACLVFDTKWETQ
jgi:hypothetical protein